MDSRRDFLKKAALLTGSAAMMNILPPAIARALAINPASGSTYLDAEHVVILMQENRSFDHCFGSLQGVRGFNDPRAIRLPNQKPVWFQTDLSGNTYAPFRLNIKDSKVTWMGDLPHSRASQVDAYNSGKYDKWLLAKRSNHKQFAEMPLTLGYYSREDLPFNYCMADAFTVCDQNFCSAMTSTTPNRSFFWTGKITHEVEGVAKAHIRNTDFGFAGLPWKTFPEILEENKIPWRFYQNELSCGGGFAAEERSWLSNFGCNNLEYFEAYNVKFSERYFRGLEKQIATLPGEIEQLKLEVPANDASALKIQTTIQKKQEVLEQAKRELIKWSPENFNKLSEKQKNLYKKAFTVNSGDPDFRSLTELNYTDNGKVRKLNVPKGDLLHQFREDVNKGQLPLVSWLAPPQNFSDHPSAPWYGAWYVSEILDILTKNPEVWKKTIFIVTYDENDGYFDHIPPFSIPDAKIPGSGKCSTGIDTEIEFVRLANELKQGVPEQAARGAAIGLGFRVPMIIASPWSKGGKVCSEVFDHTSTLQFLEGFLSKKLNKTIRMDQISEWRRTICGDLSSAFSPYDGDQHTAISFLNRDKNVETLYNAKFKQNPDGFKMVSTAEIEHYDETSGLSLQEKGIRPSCALPYELYSNGKLSEDEKSFEIEFAAGKDLFGTKAAGSPFTVYCPDSYSDQQAPAEISRNWSFAVKAGDQISYRWPLMSFDGGNYHLHLHGPNGFFRAFRGNKNHAGLVISYKYQKSKLNSAKLTGNLIVRIENKNEEEKTILITDNSYKTVNLRKVVKRNEITEIILDLSKSYYWYDSSIKLENDPLFEQRFAGKVETGSESQTDPLMGRMI